MEKEGWNWKTHLLAAVLGFGVGRYSKNIRRRQNDTTSVNTPSSLKEMLESLIDPASKDEYFFASFPPDTLVEVLLLMFSFWKAIAKEVGHPIGEKNLPSIDFDRVFEKGLHTAVAMSEYIPDEKEVSYLKRLGRFIFNNMIDQAKKVLLSSTPQVPPYVSKDVYDISERMMQRIVAKGKTEGYLSGLDNDNIIELESMLEKWKREARPEPHTKLLDFMLSAVKAS